MPSEIAHEELEELLRSRDDVQLIEVLPEEEYREEHLPGAINIPLKTFGSSTLDDLDRSRPTVVYCWNDL